MTEAEDRTVRHLYVHVPFCPTICPFCNFHVVHRRRGAVAAYLAELDRDAAERAARFEVVPSTVYIGGGTPSHLRIGEIESLFASIRRRFEIESDAEVTLEAHPADVNASTTRAWRDLGVTRLSIGVQSLDDAVLARLGRNHDSRRARTAVEHALGAGFEVVNADVITAVEEQDVAADLARVAALGVDHVSAYTLTIEPGTPFAAAGVSVDPDIEAGAYDTASTVLARAGFDQYEVSNHALPGKACRHNQAYWANRCYLGIGPGATSHEPAPIGSPWLTERRRTPPLERWLTGERGHGDRIDAATYWTESMLAGLRTTAGVSVAEVGARAGAPPESVRQAVDQGVSRGWCHRSGSRVVPTDSGLRVHNQLSALFV